MARRITSSQLRSKIQQAQSRQRQAVQKLNSNILRYNSERKKAIDSYNRTVRAHNARARANQARLRSYLQRLARQNVPVSYTLLQQSTVALNHAYERLDNSSADPFLTDLAERDTANSVATLSRLVEDDEAPEFVQDDVADTRIIAALTTISPELSNRWGGAVFALNPANPDAARHFCTSSREIIASILDTQAPDSEVFARFPDCTRTPNGTPTRPAKVRYCLALNDLHDDFLETFIDSNIDNLSALFKDLNSGAHGRAGRFSLGQLQMIKTRVEDAIGFMCEVAGISIDAKPLGTTSLGEWPVEVSL